MATKSRKPRNSTPPNHNMDEAGAAFEAAKRNPRFERTRTITLPQFKFDNARTGPNAHRDSSPLYLAVTCAAYEGKEIPGSTMGPATIANGINLETGEPGLLLLDTVLLSRLEETYPDGEYVGKAFEIVRNAWREPKPGAGYYTFALWEIAIPEELVEPVAREVRAAGNPQKAPKAASAPRGAAPVGKKPRGGNGARKPSQAPVGASAEG